MEEVAPLSSLLEEVVAQLSSLLEEAQALLEEVVAQLAVEEAAPLSDEFAALVLRPWPCCGHRTVDCIAWHRT